MTITEYAQIDEATPSGRKYFFEQAGYPDEAVLVKVDDARVILRDESGEDIILSRDVWDEEWGPHVTRIEDPDGAAEPAMDALPETAGELVEAVTGGTLVMVPSDLMESMVNAKQYLDDAIAEFNDIAEQRRQAKEEKEAAQDHYNKVSEQVLSYASRTGFPTNSPLARVAEESGAE
jgi:hypothetical protein